MGRKNRFPKPKVVRLDISDGDWIEVKSKLNVGERKKMFAESITKMGGKIGEDAEYDLDAVKMSFAKVAAYLVDWSLAEEDEKGAVVPVEISLESIQALDEDSFVEIEEAIDKHIEETEKEKKATGGKRKSAKT